jgi:HSP20 family protein
MQNKRRTRPLPPDKPSDSERQWVVQGYMVWRPNTQFHPPTDVIELSDRLVVRIEVAGVRPDDFNVSLMNHHLVITGRRDRPALEGAAYHRVEIGYGEFRVQVALPWEVAADDVNASYREGFLQIELPRQAETVVRVVDVSIDDEEEGEATDDQ